MVDERTGLKYSSFHDKKSDMVAHVCRQMRRWKHEGRPVKIIRCDDAGENKKLEKEANGHQWKLAIKFEYRPQHTATKSFGRAGIRGTDETRCGTHGKGSCANEN